MIYHIVKFLYPYRSDFNIKTAMYAVLILYDVDNMTIVHSYYFHLAKRLMKSVNCSKPKISNIPYNLIFATEFDDSSILITIISCDYLNLSLVNEYVGDVTIPTHIIKYNQNFL
jgi:hypothetical protein